MRKRVQFFTLLAIVVAGMFTLSACGGGGGGSHPTINDLVVLPGSVSVGASQTAQFSAFLGGVSTSVTWSASGGTIAVPILASLKRCTSSGYVFWPSSLMARIAWSR